MQSELNVNAPLVFLRHGATPWNEQARYQGATETELSTIGKEQAKQNALLLSELGRSGRVDRSDLKIIASPLRRAVETASILSEELALPSETVVRAREIRELSMGRWEGLTSMEVKQQFYDERKSRKGDRWNFMPEGGESLAGRSDEVAGFLSTLESNSVIVTHAGILRIILHLFEAMDFDALLRFQMPHEGLLFWDGDKTHTLTNADFIK